MLPSPTTRLVHPPRRRSTRNRLPRCAGALIRLVAFGGALALLGCSTEIFEGPPDDGDGGVGTPDSTIVPDLTDPLGVIDNDGDKYSEKQGDCDDYDIKVYPGATEICTDSIDNNCNGTVDLYEPDGDGDGFGPCQGDCNDNDITVGPLVAEKPDGVDNNCDGVIDDDYDADGYTSKNGDCNDQDATINPKAKENCHDSKDNDCNGYIDDKEPDKDKDGYGPCAGDCDDNNAKVNPGQKEIPNDGLDNNCDYLKDSDIDGDGWSVMNGDCNDGDATSYPGAKIACGSTKDQNCNNVADNLEKQDFDGDGVSACDGDCDDTDASRSPQYAEIPGDGIDNDCDNVVDVIAKCDCATGVTYAQAIDLCLSGVTITTGGAGNSHGTRQSAYGVITPHLGCGFLTLSTGPAWTTSVQPGTSLSTTGNPVATTGCMVCTTPGSTQWMHPTPKGCCENKTENDPSWVKLQIPVPKNAKGFKFDFIFLSAEYPEWVHTSYNDTFYAVQNSKSLTNVQNISFDVNGQPLTVNNGWFENPAQATQKLTGTGYDSTGSSSGWLTTTSPATPGETMTLTFWIHDEGDHIYDSAVVIDNWRWIANQVSGPITIK